MLIKCDSKRILSYNLNNKWFDMFIPCLHPISALPTKPGSHVQTNVRSGNESTTEQTAWAPHGRDSIHGFLHTLFKHANFDGQSASTVHCGVDFASTRVQPVYGSPICPGKHLHDAMWLSTRHCAPGAQSQGSWQRSLMHAKWNGQSWFVVHSGLSHAISGLPRKPSKQ